MTYGRYDSRREGREPRRMDERGERGQWRDDEDRGFFERAGDEIASWFGDDDGRRGRERDDDSYGARRSMGQSGYSERDARSTNYDRFERDPRFRDEGYRRPYTGRSMKSGFGGGSGSEERMRSDRMSHERPASGAGQREFTGMASGLHDPHYSEWRRRQIDSFDRDYDEYRRENESRFESEFGSWRQNRATKRQMLGSVTEHMQVCGSDEQPVGTVDKVRGDRIILTKDDSEDGKHHAISCSMVDRIEGGKVILDRPAEEAKAKLSSENRNRALFERDDEREEGPHILNRSFSGTY